MSGQIERIIAKFDATSETRGATGLGGRSRSCGMPPMLRSLPQQCMDFSQRRRGTGFFTPTQ